MAPPLELAIDDVAFGGNGVARHEGKAVFVPFTVDGERVSARIVREKKKFAEAELDAILAPSSFRVAAPCPYFGRCGGCQYQHISYEHQLEIKARQVEQTIRRIARLDMVPMRPIIPSPAQYGYRNRITVHVEDGVVGFYRRGEHRLIDVEMCPISRPEVNDALADLRRRHPHDGHYTLRSSDGPRVFAQTNDQVADELTRVVSSFIGSTQSLLIDAHCGSGFFAKRLLDRFEQIVGIDWDRFAIEAAQKNATDKESYIAGNIDEHIGSALMAATLDRTTVIVDPPAIGLTATIRQTLMQSPVSTLIYVSCNPPTLARDIGELKSHFIIESVTPLDMFPQTAEIEVAVHLRSS
jgi:23S rRNA (uracil1939-C5)-methyltransferase